MPIPPPTIGRYQVQRVLGRGAMGVVYLARDPLLKRQVAVKIVHCLSEDRQILLLRFQREAEISARLNHPNIVTVFDVGEDPLVGPFMTMEFVDGALLSRMVKDGLDLESLFHLLIQGAAALRASGEAGIAHRDVKPENMIVSREGRLKLMDFGIARGEESKLTQAGMVFGTPSYTAPELLVGGEASPATDRWAYTISVFELLTGALPFHGANVGATLYAVVHDEPKLPPGYPPALLAVFTRAFAKFPSQRYPDLEAFLHDLLDALPISEEAKPRLHAYLAGDLPLAWTRPFVPPAPVMHAPLPLEPAPVPEAAAIPWYGRRWAWISLASLGLAALIMVLAVLAQREPWTLDIASLPPSAEVTVDGRYKGQAPLRLPLAKGQSHLVRLERAGYEPTVREVKPGEWSLHLVLKRSPYLISVVTEPAGAEVLLNGTRMGVSPLWTLPVPSEGAQELAIRKPGYREWTTMLDREIPFPTVIQLRRAP